MRDTNFERNPLHIKPEFVPAEGDAVDHRFALSLLDFYHHNPKLYKSHLRAVLMADKELSRKIAERRAQRKQTAQKWDWLNIGTWSVVMGVSMAFAYYVVSWIVA